MRKEKEGERDRERLAEAVCVCVRESTFQVTGNFRDKQYVNVIINETNPASTPAVYSIFASSTSMGEADVNAHAIAMGIVKQNVTRKQFINCMCVCVLRVCVCVCVCLYVCVRVCVCVCVCV